MFLYKRNYNQELGIYLYLPNMYMAMRCNLSVKPIYVLIFCFYVKKSKKIRNHDISAHTALEKKNKNTN